MWDIYRERQNLVADKIGDSPIKKDMKLVPLTHFG